ncbi:MAG: tagaturonate epimerase family protein, partial [Planctomycetota bacterium]
MRLPKYSLGVGDRFGHQGVAQLDAVIMARSQGAPIAPVWNKSHREHGIVRSSPDDVRREADAAVAARGWSDPCFVDADHIGLANVDGFLASSDFFTLDVADFIGAPPDADDLARFVRKHDRLVGRLELPGLDEPLEISHRTLETASQTFLRAVREAGRIYRRVEGTKGAGTFVTEVSMDETDRPQSPAAMLVILAAVADEGIPAQTIAPRFSGRFNKGVDYVGDVDQFALEFERHLGVIAFAVDELGLPENLKLSVHSGSDKFSIYGP